MKHISEEKVRGEIIDAAAEVFEKYGFTRASMLDISKASKKGRSTLYYYFGNKMEVFDALVEKVSLELINQCKGAVEQHAPIAVNMERFHLLKLQKITELVSKYHLVIEDLQQDPSLVLSKLRFLRTEEITVVSKIIRWGIESEEILPMNDADNLFLAEIIVTAFKSFEQEMVLFNRLTNLETRLSWLSQILYKGLR